MKAGIHPEIHPVTVHCACGNEFETYTTAKELRLEICGKCHPYYTGKKRMVTARGRVEQFERRYGTTGVAVSKKPVIAKKKKATTATTTTTAKTKKRK